jgi:hypothetical protein
MSVINELISRTCRKIQQEREAHPGHDSLQGSFTFANCIVTFSLSHNNKEMEVWNPIKDTYLDCIASLLKKETPQLHELDANEPDIWDAHGFRNEQDYINYKYR